MRQGKVVVQRLGQVEAQACEVRLERREVRMRGGTETWGLDACCDAQRDVPQASRRREEEEKKREHEPSKTSGFRETITSLCSSSYLTGCGRFL